MDNNLVEKIKKLLGLATSSNPHESDLAMAKARMLCAENDIDMAALELDRKQAPVKEQFVRDDIHAGQRKNITQDAVTHILIAHFKVRIVYSGSREAGQRICIIGRASDVALATYINGFLNNEFMRRWHNFKEQNFSNTQERSAFIFGMRKGLDEKLTEAKNRAEQNKLNSMANGNAVQNQYAIMLVDENKARALAVIKLVGQTKPVAAKKISGSMESLEAGIQEGKKININSPLGAGSQRMALV